MIHVHARDPDAPPPATPRLSPAVKPSTPMTRIPADAQAPTPFVVPYKPRTLL